MNRDDKILFAYAIFAAFCFGWIIREMFADNDEFHLRQRLAITSEAYIILKSIVRQAAKEDRI